MSLATMLSGAVLDTILARLTVLFLTGSGGDLAAAHHGAAKMLAGYHPETEDELRLAAEIVSFGFHALEALSQAASHDLPLTKILRLRGSAVSLSRQSHRSQHRLDQLQRDRRTSRAAQPAAALPQEPPAPQASALPQEPAAPRPSSLPQEPPAPRPSSLPQEPPAPQASSSPQASEPPELPSLPQAPQAPGPSRPRDDTAPLIETIQTSEATGSSSFKTWTKSYQQRRTARRIAENLKRNQAAHLALPPPSPDAASR
jgi:outer membrane biosynthesis protein TonB